MSFSGGGRAALPAAPAAGSAGAALQSQNVDPAAFNGAITGGGADYLNSLQASYQRNMSNGFYTNRPNRKAVDEQKIATVSRNVQSLPALQKRFDSFALSTGVSVPNMSSEAAAYLLESNDPFEAWKAVQIGRFANASNHSGDTQAGTSNASGSAIVAGPGGAPGQAQTDQVARDDQYWRGQAVQVLEQNRSSRTR